MGTKNEEDEETIKMRNTLVARQARRDPDHHIIVLLPDGFPRLPSDVAMAKLRRGEYVPSLALYQ